MLQRRLRAPPNGAHPFPLVLPRDRSSALAPSCCPDRRDAPAARPARVCLTLPRAVAALRRRSPPSEPRAAPHLRGQRPRSRGKRLPPPPTGGRWAPSARSDALAGPPRDRRRRSSVALLAGNPARARRAPFWRRSARGRARARRARRRGGRRRCHRVPRARRGGAWHARRLRDRLRRRVRRHRPTPASLRPRRGRDGAHERSRERFPIVDRPSRA